jgi:N-methylhydantoinase A
LAAEHVTAVLDQFSAAHRRHYGHGMDDPAEIVTLRLRAIGLLPRPEIPRIPRGGGSGPPRPGGRRSVYRGVTGDYAEYDVYARGALRSSDVLAGPAIVEESSSTTVIHEGDTLTVGDFGELIIRGP